MFDMDIFTTIGFLVVVYHVVYWILSFNLDCDIALAYKEKYGQPLQTLHGKVVWITGASSGIGEHLAYELANSGCKLILTARRRWELERVQRNCLNANTCLTENDIDIIAFDICDLDLHQSALQRIIARFGKLDILVNNAGRSQRANWEEIDLEVDKQLFDLNVFSVLHLSRLVAKHFLERKSGHFVVTSSLAGISAVPYSASYTASKHALHGYFNSFMLEKLNKGVSVTMVCPGPIQTNFLAECFTGRNSEKYGQATEVSSTKVCVKRCAKLMAVAIANKLPEVWIATRLPLQLTYTLKYFPNLGSKIIKSLGAKFLLKVRDDKTNDKTVMTST